MRVGFPARPARRATRRAPGRPSSGVIIAVELEVAAAVQIAGRRRCRRDAIAGSPSARPSATGALRSTWPDVAEQVGAPRTTSGAAAVERAVLRRRTRPTRRARGRAAGAAARDSRPLAVLPALRVDLVVEVELLGGRRAVGDARPATTTSRPAPNLRAHLDAERRAGRVAGDQRRRDAEALVGLALAVLDADHRVELADEDRRAPATRSASIRAARGRRR